MKKNYSMKVLDSKTRSIRLVDPTNKKGRKWSQLWPQIFLYYDIGDLWHKMRFI